MSRHYRSVILWAHVPMNRRVTDRTMFEHPQTWKAKRFADWNLPAPAERCVAASQGDTGFHMWIHREHLYYRCPQRIRPPSPGASIPPGSEKMCPYHRIQARRGGIATR